MFSSSAQHCHSQGDTVLVGGPPGEKGNKGELVSECPDGSKVLWFFVFFLINNFPVVCVWF